MSGNIKWTDLSDEQRKILRIRNTESSRKNRRKWKKQDSDMKEIYDSNERRIQKLESMVVTLSSELQKGSGSSAPSSTTPPSSHHKSSHSATRKSSKSTRT